MWTDRQNLAYANTEHASNRVLHQKILLEEYAVDLKWIKGTKNEAVDILSRNEFIYKPTTTVDTAKSDTMMHEMFANEIKVPIDYLTIRNYQLDDQELIKNRTSLFPNLISRIYCH